MAQQDDMDQVARIAAREMGEAPPQPEAAPAPAQAEAPTTEQEKAAEVASPKTEGDKSQEPPLMYKINMNGEERNLTPQQISGTFERYRDLNHKNAQMKPVNDLVNKMMEASGSNPEQVAKLIQAATQAFTKNAKMGRAQDPNTAGVANPEQPSNMPQGNDLEAEYKKYEDDNAISLPPGYRESMDRMARMEQQMQSTMASIQKVLQASQQSAQAGQMSAQNAQGNRMAAIRQSISNNLNSAQAKAGLSDDDAKPFMAFAGERGYTAEDFALFRTAQSGTLATLANMITSVMCTTTHLDSATLPLI